MIRQLLPLITGIITLVGMWAAGSHRSWSWALGIANQALWFAFIVVFGAWGLLPLNVALVVVYSRNLLKWRREADAARLEGELAAMDDPLNGIPTRPPLFGSGSQRGTGQSAAATPAKPLDADEAARLLLPGATPRSVLADDVLDAYRDGGLTRDEALALLFG